MPKTTLLLVVANNGYQPIEYETPKKHLKQAGIKVVTASNKPGGAVASDGSTTDVDIILDDVVMTDYDGIFFIGGPGAMEHLDIPQSYHLLAVAKKLNKAYGAICIAPRILAKAGVLKDKRATGWNGDNVVPGLFDGYGVIYQDKPAVRDGNVITASGPDSAAAFAQEIINAFTL